MTIKQHVAMCRDLLSVMKPQSDGDTTILFNAGKQLDAIDAMAAVSDKGPWHVTKFARGVASEQFDVDAMLSLDGDFEDEAHRLRYATWLCGVLNADAAPDDAARYRFIRFSGGCPLEGWPEAATNAERDAAVDAAMRKAKLP